MDAMTSSGRVWAPGRAPQVPQCTTVLESFFSQCCTYRHEEAVDVEVEETPRANVAYTLVDAQEPPPFLQNQADGCASDRGGGQRGLHGYAERLVRWEPSSKLRGGTIIAATGASCRGAAARRPAVEQCVAPNQVTMKRPGKPELMLFADIVQGQHSGKGTDAAWEGEGHTLSTCPPETPTATPTAGFEPVAVAGEANWIF